MIQEITLNRFKKFKEYTIQLKPFSVLTGKNGCGKSTILKAINLMIYTLHENEMITFKGGHAIIRSKGVGAADMPGMKISDFRDLYYGKISRQGKQVVVDESKIGASIIIKDENDNVYKMLITSIFGGFNMKCYSQEEDLKNMPSLQIYTPLYISGFTGIQMMEEKVFPVIMQKQMTRGGQSSIIRNMILRLRKVKYEQYQELKELMAEEFSFCIDRVECNENKEIYVKASFLTECGDGMVSMDFDNASDGELQVLQILSAIYLSCPDQCKVVLIDNPEAYLHPEFQRKLVRVLKRMQREMRIQIILATHSREIMDEVDKEEVMIIDEEAANHGRGDQMSEKVMGEGEKKKIRGEQLTLEL